MAGDTTLRYHFLSLAFYVQIVHTDMWHCKPYQQVRGEGGEGRGAASKGEGGERGGGGSHIIMIYMGHGMCLVRIHYVT